MGKVIRGMVLGTLMLSSVTNAHGQRPFRFDDLFAIDHVRTAAIAPNAEQVAFVTERWTPESYFGRSSVLWLVSARGGEPQRAEALSFERNQSFPVWSPDSQRLVYIAQIESGSRLRLVDVAGGHSVETVPACESDESIGAPTWSPDGTQLALLCGRSLPWEPATAKTIVASESEFFNGSPYPASTESRLVLVDLPSKSTRELVKSINFLAVAGSVTWRSPKTIWIMGTPAGANAGTIDHEDRLAFRYDLDTATLEVQPNAWRGATAAFLSSRGDEFILIGGGRPSGGWRQDWRPLPLLLSRGSWDGELVPLSQPLDLALSRMSQFAQSAAPNGDPEGVIYFTEFTRGSSRVKGFYAGSRQWTDITSANVTVESFSVSATGSTMAIVQGDAGTLPELYLMDLTRSGGKPVRLTRFGDKVRDLFAVPQVERLNWRSTDDRFDIDGWLVKPHGYEKGKRYPLIVDVHGGPGVAFRNRFENLLLQGAHQVPPALYAAHGYMVLMVNPRGDPGYGRAHMEALLEGWEYPTRYDIFSGVDHVIKLGYADPERLGIGGASYGGWVTTYAVTQTDRFKAASANDPVIDSALSSAAAYRGARSSNYWLHATFAGGLPDDPTPRLPSPDPSRVKTPILLRFGLVEQKPFPSQFYVSGVPYFTYLHARCRPVELILHPEEGHGVFDGATWREYVERDVRWFDYWIKGEGESPLKPWTCES